MSSRSTVSRLTLIVSIIVALLIATSCSKKSEQSVEELVKAGLLQELPPATQGFIYWNFSSSEFKNYQKKMGAGGFANLIEKIVERQQAIQQMEQPEISRALTNWAQKHGVLVSESALGSPSVQEGVLFLEMKSDLPLPNLAMYLSTDTNQEAKTLLSELQSILQSNQVSIEEISFGDLSAISIPLRKVVEDTQGSAPSTKNVPIAVMAAAKGKRVVFATSEHLLKHGFDSSETSTDGFTLLKASDGFKDLDQKLSANGVYTRLAYFDFDSFLERMKGFISMIPDQEAQKWLSKDQAPVRGVMMKSWLDPKSGRYHSDGGVSFSSEFISQYANTLSSNPSGKSLTGLAPEQTALWLSLSGSIIKLAMQYSPTNQDDQVNKELKGLLDLESVGLALIPSEGAQLFPGLSVIARHQDSPELVKELKAQLSSQQSQSPLPLSQWQTKSVDGKNVDYVLSPIGLGIYLTAFGDNIVLTTNEDTLKKIFRTENGKQAALSGFSSSPSSLAEFYLDANGIANLLESLQGSLSMFTGGEPIISPADMVAVRELGQGAFVLSFTDHSLIYQSNHQIQ